MAQTRTAREHRPSKLDREQDDGGARQRISDIQRTRILWATGAVAAEQGAANMTVAQIVARSGVSRRTFYEFFADGGDCYLAAFEEAVAQATLRVEDAYDPRVKWSVRIRASLIALLRFLEEEPAIARLLIVESLAAGPDALSRRTRVLGRIVAKVNEGHAHAGEDDPPRLTGEGVVGAVLAILHARLLEGDAVELMDLANPLMSIIVLPYLGGAASRQELTRPPPRSDRVTPKSPEAPDPWRQLGMRLTYRTVRVLRAVALTPGSSNRMIGERAGIGDQGQISKLLRRLQGFGLIETSGEGAASGEPNAWTLTSRGQSLLQTIV